MFKEVKYIIKLYEDKKGEEPFVLWISSLKDISMQARVKNRIKRIQLGNFGDCKSIDKSIFELRLNFGPGYRVYFAKESNVVVLLLCGGNKKTQNKDIKKAKMYWDNYKNS